MRPAQTARDIDRRELRRRLASAARRAESLHDEIDSIATDLYQDGTHSSRAALWTVRAQRRIKESQAHLEEAAGWL